MTTRLKIPPLLTLQDLSVYWQDFQQLRRNLPQTETLGRSSQSWAGKEDYEEFDQSFDNCLYSAASPKYVGELKGKCVPEQLNTYSTTAAEKKENVEVWRKESFKNGKYYWYVDLHGIHQPRVYKFRCRVNCRINPKPWKGQLV